MRAKISMIAAVALLIATRLTAWPQDSIPFVPTPMEIVERMLMLAEVKQTDLLYDLGSGDGRIVITAAKKYGARGIGVDLDPKLVEQARRKAVEEGVSHLVEFRAGDGLQVDVSDATVVTLYMFKWFNNAMRPKLQRLRPGSRIVAHDFDIDDWKPTKIEYLNPDDSSEYTTPRTLYLWKLEAP